MKILFRITCEKKKVLEQEKVHFIEREKMNPLKLVDQNLTIFSIVNVVSI